MDRLKDNIWFPELVGYSAPYYPGFCKNDCFIYVFVSPLPLTEKEREEIEIYKDTDPDYYNGVYNGWGIMFLGNTHKNIIVPGMMDRKQIIKKVPHDFLRDYKDFSFTFSDGEPSTP